VFIRLLLQLGLFPKVVSRWLWVGHNGSYGGYESEHWFDKSRGLTLAVLTNRNGWDSTDGSISNRLWMALASALDASTPSTWGPCV
jgi:hypothetical protein